MCATDFIQLDAISFYHFANNLRHCIPLQNRCISISTVSIREMIKIDFKKLEKGIFNMSTRHEM